MFKSSRLSKKIFFAAAALGAASVLPAAGAVVEIKDTDTAICNANTNDTYSGTWMTGWTRFEKTGTGRLTVTSLGTSGGSLYSGHVFGVTPHSSPTVDGPYYYRDRYSGNITQTASEYTYCYGEANSMKYSMESLTNNISFGEVVVKEGVLNLRGYVNAWHDYGANFNMYAAGAQNSAYSASQRANGFMAGVSKITVNNGATLDLSGNINATESGVPSYQMVADNSQTTFQFLHNLQSGDLGADTSSTLFLGDSSAFHVNIHVDGWDENVRTLTSARTYFDTALAFGGSIGILSGAGSVYKTGDGAFTILNSNATFTGSLYAAGGSLVLAADNTIGSDYSFKDAEGNVIKARVSSSVESAESVNIAGTYNSGKSANGGSMQGSTVALNETYQTVTWQDTDDNTHEEVYTAINESFFTTPSAGTLVVAENQVISNFQSLFAAGYSVADGTTAADAIRVAANNSGVLAPWSSSGVNTGTTDAPIIAGTGTGSTLVVVGGIYGKDADGNYNTSQLITDDYGYLRGGLLVIDQDAGKGGVYEGSIVGCRVSVYNKSTFAELTEIREDTQAADLVSDRKKEARLNESVIKSDIEKALGTSITDAEWNALDFNEEDGSFAVDSELALKIIEYYKEPHEDNFYYIDYMADASVKGGLVVLKGAGDLALLLESANYSGLYLDAARTGKTVLNITSVNTIPDSVVALGGGVSFVSNLDNTLGVELDFAAGTSLIFTTADTISTLSGTIRVGDVRKSLIGFSVTQDSVYGDVYVERGIGLNLTGTDDIFGNASSLTIWEGAFVANTSTAAASLALLGNARQTINNLTGDSVASLSLGTGALTVNITDNTVDARSGLTRGTYDGGISGPGSLIKGGSGTFTLGGGIANRAFTGDISVAESALHVSAENGISGASALILNAGTTVEMTGSQTVRNLFGSSEATLTVKDGTLTLGANAVPANGDNRPLVSNNLGSSSDALAPENAGVESFARFENGFDLEGNKLYPNGTSSLSFASQAEATSAYLTATAKLAYSGFDASVLERFVGVKNSAGAVIFSRDDYEALLSSAKDGKTLLSSLAERYDELSEAKYFADNIKATSTSNGYYDPSAVLRQFFTSDSAYKQYVNGETFAALVSEAYKELYGEEDIPSNPTTAEKKAVNAALYQAICTAYEDFSAKIAATENAALKKTFTTATSSSVITGKFEAAFGNVKNLGGTDLLSDYNAQITDVGKLLDEYNANVAEKTELEKQLETETDEEKINDLRDRISDLNDEIAAASKELYGTDGSEGALAALADLYDAVSAAAALIETKNQFAGIEIVGAFANSVKTDGTLVDADGWVGDLAFAGTIETTSLVKTGDNTVKLTGSLNGLGQLVINAGTLAIDEDTLDGSDVANGISVARGASLSVSVAGEDAVFDYAVSGAGNFVKDGAGTLTLGDGVLYTGTTTIRGGTLQMTLRESVVSDDGTFIAEQGDIYLADDSVKLILSQNDDVEWNGNIFADASSDVSVEKIGAGTLTVSGDVALGDDAELRVSEGGLLLSGEFSTGENSIVIIGNPTNSGGAESTSGARLALVDATSTSLRIYGDGALDIGTDSTRGNVSLVGSDDYDGINGDGEENDWFAGTVTVRKDSTLTLSGESLFDHARGIVLSANATLELVDGTTQTVKSLSGYASSEVSLAAGTELNFINNDSEARIKMDYSSETYQFNESTLLSAADFAGRISGNGAISVSGTGLVALSGEIESGITVKVSDGGQLLLSLDPFSGSVSSSELSVEVNGAKSELLLSVGVGNEASVDSGVLTFENNGVLGKIGDGTLSVDSRLLDACGGVNVYEGTLSVDGWNSGLKKSVADGATLSVKLDIDDVLNLTEVFGSGTLELMLTTDQAISGSEKTLPVSGPNGNFFNGKISFDCAETDAIAVTLESLEIAAINATENLGSLTLTDGVVINQTQNSKIECDLYVTGDVLVRGTSADAGSALSDSARRLSITKDFKVSGNDAFSLKNVGFELRNDLELNVVVDSESEKNTFYFSMAEDSDSASHSTIGVDIDVNIVDPAATSSLRELSLIKTGAGTLTVSGETISTDFGAAASDSVFGVSSGVYDQLLKNGGTLNVGTESGTLVLTDVGDFTGQTANGVAVNLVTLRSTVAPTAGTLEIRSDASEGSVSGRSRGFLAAFSADAAGTSSARQTLDRTISGTGNVEFSGSAGTLVTAAQTYLGETTVSGVAEFSGAGRNSASARITVENGGELIGGAVMKSREISYTGTARRNISDTGAAGSATLNLKISDPRLPKDIVLQVEVDNGDVVSAAVLSSSSLEELGIGVDVDAVKVDDDGQLVIPVTDSAFSGSGSYAVSVDVSSLPKSVGENANLTGTSEVAGTFIVSAGGKLTLDMLAGDTVSAGTVVLESGSKISLTNLDSPDALGKALTVVDATSVGTSESNLAAYAEGDAAAIADRSDVVANALRANDIAAETPIMVFTTSSGAICAQRIISDFTETGVDFNDGIDDSFLGALSLVATAGYDMKENVLNADRWKESDVSGKALFMALNGISASSLSDEVTKLSPLGYASMLAMPVSVFNSDIARLHERLDQRRYDAANPLHESGEYEFFVSAQSDFTENGSGNSSPTFDYNLYGVYAGCDFKPTFETTLGLAVGYTYGKATIHDGGGKVKMDDMRVTAFASRLFGNFYLDLGAQLGFADFDLRRRTVAGTTSGDTDSLLAGAFATVGAAFSLWQDKKDGSGLYFTPSIGLSYMHTRISDFDESGTAGLDIDDADGDSLRARVAAGLQWVFPCAEWEMRLGLEVAYAHEFLGDELDMDGRFSNWRAASFSVSGKALAEDTFSIGPTASLRLSDYDSLFCGYGFEVGTNSSVSHSLSVGYRRRF